LIFERLIFERLIFERLIFERLIFERLIFERLIFERLIFERFIFDNRLRRGENPMTFILTLGRNYQPGKPIANCIDRALETAVANRIYSNFTKSDRSQLK